MIFSQCANKRALAIYWFRIVAEALVVSFYFISYFAAWQNHFSLAITWDAVAHKADDHDKQYDNDEDVEDGDEDGAEAEVEAEAGDEDEDFRAQLGRSDCATC